MAYLSPHGRYDYSRSPSHRYRSMSRSRSPARRYDSEDDAYNPGNNLYVTGIPVRATERDLEDYFSMEGKVVECHLVTDPRTKESRGFGFVTMGSLKDADRCIKYLDKSVFQGRVITVEKARRKKARTPTPGRYLGVKTRVSSVNERRRGYYEDNYDLRRSPTYSPYRSSGERSPRYSPYHRRHYSPSYPSRRDRSPSPYYRYGASRSRVRSISPSPPCYRRRIRSRSISPSPRPRSYSRSPSHEGRYVSRRLRCHRSRSFSSRSRSYLRGSSHSPRRSRSRSISRLSSYDSHR